MELRSKEKFKFLSLKQYESKKNDNVYLIAQFHDGNDVYEFFIDNEQVRKLPKQFEDVDLIFELSKYRNNATLRLKDIQVNENAGK